MNSKKIVLSVFILMVVVQLYVPAKMIWDRENVLTSGTEYKFRTAPVDPNDPFRGKYITLSYSDNTVVVSDEQEWKRGETIYAVLTTDDDGFARIKSVSKEKPATGHDFVKANVGFLWDDSRKLSVDYPFDRFYMEESKAYDAERQYRASQRDTTQTTYALVDIKDGDAVLKDVLIDGIPLRELVDANVNTIEQQ